MERILETSIKDFSTQFGYSNLSEADRFERFCNYSICSQEIPQLTVTRDLIEDFTIGNGNDWGIDGFIILANKKPISSVAEVKSISDMELKVDVILVQAKTSTTVNVGELGKFLEGAKNILRYINDRPNRQKLPPKNPDLDEKLQILDALYDCPSLGSEIDSGHPRLKLLYCVTGHNSGTQDHLALCSSFHDDLNKQMLTVDNTCTIIPYPELNRLYKHNRVRIHNTIIIDSAITFHNNMEGISESHLCLVSFPEFKKLMILSGENGTSNDKMIKSIFEDNVRDYQGDNPVNTAIANSIKAGDSKLFAVLNNGITIIARKGSLKGRSLHLQDYQIVNGCQTCHVLFENRNEPDVSSLMLTVKVIFSTNQDIRDKIIVANNNQTQIMQEQLTSLLDTQRNIEDYYKSENRFEKLYYERRSKQYKYGEEKIHASRIITIPAQLKAYVSMILGKPHMTSQYYGVLLQEFNGKNGKEKIIDPDAKPSFYYTSALAAFKRDWLLSDGSLPKKAKYVKHHLLYAFPLVAIDKARPHLNSNNADKYCDELCEILCNEEKCKKAFENAYYLICETLKREPHSTDLNDSELAKKIANHYHQNKINIKQEDTTILISEQKQSTSKPGIKILGKIDLDTLNQNTRPKRRRR